MQLKSAGYLRDMLDAARTIQGYVAGMSADQFVANRLLRDASHWNLCVIGEAMSQLRKLDEATARRVGGYPKIIALRNQIIHGYPTIDFGITWNIIQLHLPPLIEQLELLLTEAPPPDSTDPTDEK